MSIQLFAHQPRRKSLKCSDKGTLTIPLAAALLYTNIVKVQQGADLNNLKQQDPKKSGPFSVDVMYIKVAPLNIDSLEFRRYLSVPRQVCALIFSQSFCCMCNV